MKPRFYTGEDGHGDGSISFCPGNPNSPIVNPAPRERPLPDFSKGIPKKFSIGPVDNWGEYRQEMGVRDEGTRGLAIDYQHPHHKALGIRDHKEAVAKRMLEALHDGDSGYFEGLAKMLRKFKSVNGNPKPEPGDQDQEVLDAIRIAAQEADAPPFQHEVLTALGWRGYKLDKLLEHYLIPLGFGWLPRRKGGRPKKLP